MGYKQITVAIHQPNYLPWIGYFYKILKADKFVFLDNVQYTKNSFINRNKIKSSNGVLWLTVPVLHKGKSEQIIKDVKINNNVKWQKKHLNAIKMNYSKAKYFGEVFGLIHKYYDSYEWDSLADLNETLIIEISRYLGVDIESKFVRASNLKAEGKSSELLANICAELRADVYLSGIGAKKYMDEEPFKQKGIKVLYSNFKHPEYPQLYGKFVPNLSILDLLFNVGRRSPELILNEE